MTTLLSAAALWAVPAYPGTSKVQQPDGTYVTIRLVGDEWCHFHTTADGYSVVQDDRGYYVYAEKKDGRLQATARVAHDEDARTASEREYLSAVRKYQAPIIPEQVQQVRSRVQLHQQQTLVSRRSQMYNYNYKKFKGLIILVQFNDKEFSREDYPQILDDMVNKEDYTGYDKEQFTGSVRDYFSDNSNGKFQPQFDVVGPVTINYSQYDCLGGYQWGEPGYDSWRSSYITLAAIRAADADVDFRKYDGDGDGKVDLVFFVFAGNGANYDGNDKRLWWPQRSIVIDPDRYWEDVKCDGVVLEDCASSVELQGYTSYPTTVKIDGIGTICHEFSHCLGLPDFYDTDSDGSGGVNQAYPLTWSIMASGFKNNNGRSPAGYSLFERYALGFAQPTLIEGEGTISVPALEKSNMGYRLNTANENEYFIIENRQRIKWDKNLAGPGMLIWRVDSTNVDVWENNLVNSNPNHNYYELLRANFNGMTDSYNDPFPGVSNVTSINNSTQPNLRTWDGQLSHYAFVNIAQADSIITFDVVIDKSKIAIEDFEMMPVAETLNERGVEGIYANWDFYNCAVVDTAQVGNGHVVAMTNGSYFNTVENLNKIPKVVHFTIYNPTSTGVMITPQYSKDNGKKWRGLDEYPYDFYVKAGATATATIACLPTDVPIMRRIKQTSGSSSEYCFIDDIEICYEETWTPEYILGDVDDDGEVTISDVTALIDYLLNSDATGINLQAADVDEDGAIAIADVTTLIDMLLRM